MKAFVTEHYGLINCSAVRILFQCYLSVEISALNNL